MGKKIKSLATLLVALTAVFSLTTLVSCTDNNEEETPEVESSTLVSIAVQTQPSRTEFNVGDSFYTAGLVVYATYEDGTSSKVTGYTVSEPDMSTAGDKEVTITYTEGDVTVSTSYTITVNPVEYTKIEISSSWSLQTGMEVATIAPTVQVTLNTAVVKTLDTSEYTLEIKDSDGLAVTEGYIQGNSTYTVTVTLNADESFSTTETYTTTDADSFKLEAEDAETTGFVEVFQAGESSSDSNYWGGAGLAITSTGGTYAGGTLTFNFYALAGTYDLSFNVSSNLVYNTASSSSEDYGLGNSANYDQTPNAVSDTVDITVNGSEYEIPDTATFTETTGAAYLYEFFSNYQEINLGNVTLNNGLNTIVFELGESKSGISNRWGNPPSFNVDYIQFKKEDPKEESAVSSISIEKSPWVTQYMLGDELDTRNLLLKVEYEDSTTGYVCSNFTTEFDNATAGYQNVTVTYGGASTTYQVYVIGDPDSITIDTSFALYHGDDLSNLELSVTGDYDGDTLDIDPSMYTVTVTDEDGGAVTETTAQFGKKYKITATYTLTSGESLTDSITCFASYKVNAEDASEISNGNVQTNNNSNTLVVFDLGQEGGSKPSSGYIVFNTPSLEEAGTYNISFELINGNIAASSTSANEFNLGNVVDVTVNDASHDISNVVLDAFSNSGGSSTIYNDEFIQLTDFGNVSLNAGVNTIRLDITYKEEYQNRWSAVLLSIDTFILSEATA